MNSQIISIGSLILELFFVTGFIFIFVKAERPVLRFLALLILVSACIVIAMRFTGKETDNIPQHQTAPTGNQPAEPAQYEETPSAQAGRGLSFYINFTYLI